MVGKNGGHAIDRVPTNIVNKKSFTFSYCVPL